MCETDNNSLLDAVKCAKSVTGKGLCLEISSIEELIHSGTIQQVMWSATKEQFSDCLTKETSALFLLLTMVCGDLNAKRTRQQRPSYHQNVVVEVETLSVYLLKG